MAMVALTTRNSPAHFFEPTSFDRAKRHSSHLGFTPIASHTLYVFKSTLFINSTYNTTISHLILHAVAAAHCHISSLAKNVVYM